MPQRKLTFLKALLSLSLLAMALTVFRRKPDAWEYERVEDEVEVTPAVPRAAAGEKEGRKGGGIPEAPSRVADVGGSVRLLSKLTEDEPTTAWGEGDRYLAVSGGTGVYIIDVANGQATQLVPTGGFGGIDWTR